VESEKQDNGDTTSPRHTTGQIGKSTKTLAGPSIRSETEKSQRKGKGEKEAGRGGAQAHLKGQKTADIKKGGTAISKKKLKVTGVPGQTRREGKKENKWQTRHGVNSLPPNRNRSKAINGTGNQESTRVEKKKGNQPKVEAPNKNPKADARCSMPREKKTQTVRPIGEREQPRTSEVSTGLMKEQRENPTKKGPFLTGGKGSRWPTDIA